MPSSLSHCWDKIHDTTYRRRLFFFFFRFIGFSPRMVTWLQGRYVMVGSIAKEAAIPVAAGKQREGRGQEQDCSLAAYTPAPGPPPCGTFTRELLHGWVHGPHHHAPRPNHPQTYKAFEGHFSFKLHYNVANFNTHPGNIPPGRLSTITTVGQSSTIIKKWIVVKTQILNFSSEKPHCFQITRIILHTERKSFYYHCTNKEV